jgi:hypothetical protein
MLYEFVCSNFGGFGNDEKRINAYDRQGIVGKIGWYLHILIFKLLKKMQMLKKSLIDLLKKIWQPLRSPPEISQQLKQVK